MFFNFLFIPNRSMGLKPKKGWLSLLPNTPHLNPYALTKFTFRAKNLTDNQICPSRGTRKDFFMIKQLL